MISIFPLDLSIGMIARTLVIKDDEQYEVVTRNILDSVDVDTREFWYELLKDYPYETTVYRCVPSAKPLSPIEVQLASLVPINSTIRRDLDTGDLYVSRSINEEAAALEHDAVIENFKKDSLPLMTLLERIAVYGPGKIVT